MDLRRQPPRRPSNTSVAGIVGVARMTDKARASNHGTLGEYLYGEDSGLDKTVLEFLGISAKEFAEAVEKYDDAELSAWVLERSRKTKSEIAAFNEMKLTEEPQGEAAKARLAQRLQQYAPGRTDIKTVFQSMELDDWGGFWRVDLSQRPPRSPYCKDVAGIVLVARMADKARASKAGTLGEYIYGCPLDMITLPFLGISKEEFADAAVQNPNDIELGDWALERSGRAKEEIEEFNRTAKARKPESDEERARFQKYLNEIAPGRTDIDTWFELLDLDDKMSF
ncbi:MAG: DUF5069 domain-containing protein [Candidatus Poribacteria bacterium]